MSQANELSSLVSQEDVSGSVILFFLHMGYAATTGVFTNVVSYWAFLLFPLVIKFVVENIQLVATLIKPSLQRATITRTKLAILGLKAVVMAPLYSLIAFALGRLDPCGQSSNLSGSYTGQIL